jgi:hypothetical protein
MLTACSFDKLVNIYHNTWRHAQVECNLQNLDNPQLKCRCCNQDLKQISPDYRSHATLWYLRPPKEIRSTLLSAWLYLHIITRFLWNVLNRPPLCMTTIGLFKFMDQNWIKPTDASLLPTLLSTHKKYLWFWRHSVLSTCTEIYTPGLILSHMSVIIAVHKMIGTQLWNETTEVPVTINRHCRTNNRTHCWLHEWRVA